MADQKSAFKICVFIGVKYGTISGDLVYRDPSTRIELEATRIVSEEVGKFENAAYWYGFIGGGLTITITENNTFKIEIVGGDKKNLEELVRHLTRRISCLMECYR
jgi:hypothetical protein